MSCVLLYWVSRSLSPPLLAPLPAPFPLLGHQMAADEFYGAKTTYSELRHLVSPHLGFVKGQDGQHVLSKSLNRSFRRHGAAPGTA